MIKRGFNKGYFYTLDAVIGLIILVVGLLVLISIHSYSPSKETTKGLSNDISSILSRIKINDVCSNIETCSCSYPSIKDACNAGLLYNEDMTLLELLGLFYFKNQMFRGEALINETIIETNILPYSHDMQVILVDPNDPDVSHQLYPLVES